MGERVLVVDDEADMLRLVDFNLREAGFQTQTATSGGEALIKAARYSPAVVVLDWMLPDIEGPEACRRLRQDAQLAEVGILILTARGADQDRVLGLEAGADDYVVKPFNVREVVLRVQALERRCGERRAARAAAGPAEILGWRSLEVDLRSHRVSLAGKHLHLRPMEYKLLVTFLENPDTVFSRDELLSRIWEISSDVSTRTVDTHVRRLRSHLSPTEDAIETVHGFGYRLREA